MTKLLFLWCFGFRHIQIHYKTTLLTLLLSKLPFAFHKVHYFFSLGLEMCNLYPMFVCFRQYFVDEDDTVPQKASKSSLLFAIYSSLSNESFVCLVYIADRCSSW